MARAPAVLPSPTMGIDERFVHRPNFTFIAKTPLYAPDGHLPLQADGLTFLLLWGRDPRLGSSGPFARSCIERPQRVARTVSEATHAAGEESLHVVVVHKDPR